MPFIITDIPGHLIENLLGRLEIVLSPASLSERNSVLWWLTGPVSAYTELHPYGQQFNSAGPKTIALTPP